MRHDAECLKVMTDADYDKLDKFERKRASDSLPITKEWLESEFDWQIEEGILQDLELDSSNLSYGRTKIAYLFYSKQCKIYVHNSHMSMAWQLLPPRIITRGNLLKLIEVMKGE